MSAIAVIHPDFSYRGGGESVALHTIHAIQCEFPDSDVDVITRSDPNWEDLAEYFDIRLDFERLNTLSINIPWSVLNSNNFLLLQRAIFQRVSHLMLLRSQYKSIISTQNEMNGQNKTIQYIHRPQPPFIKNKSSLIEKIYSDICQFISGFDRSDIMMDHLLANSEYTANAVEDLYDSSPEIVYPPVDTRGIEANKWSERENGFVTIGRISPEKRVLESIRTIESVVDAGYDTHLHLIGPAGNTEYSERVLEYIDDLDFIYFEGEMSHSNRELEKMMNKHKFLISHCTESFGISIAESVAAGMIPFVIDTGGQTEIVGQRKLIFTDMEEASKKVIEVYSNKSLQYNIRQNFPDISKRFGRDRFMREITNILKRNMTNNH